MKKKYTLLSLLFFSAFIFGQVEDVIINIGSTGRLYEDGANLYYSYYGQIDTFSMIDELNPTTTLFASGMSSPRGMAKYSDDFYIAVFGQGKIIKFDINDTEPNYIDVTDVGDTPNTMIIDNDYLYYSDNNGGSIYKYDLNGSSNTAELLVSDYLSVTGLAVKDDFLYFSVSFDNAVYKLDLNNPNATPAIVASGFWHPLGIKFNGNDLYIAAQNDDTIYKIDVSQNPVQLSLVMPVDSFFRPRDIEFLGSYMCILEADRLSRVELSSLSVTSEEIENTLKLTPNPATDNIKLLNLKAQQSYSIYDINGRIILQGIIYPNQNINVSSLSNGCYFVKLKNAFDAFRFIKI